ncbi:hypothetical protein NS220_04395 [Microbacterium testaceum]|uniref:Uncharacterized protein n=1 Tax=Microbacterium testaceum TaxID=2033 RepID=A0A147EZQ1_MICTE|nr:hypothetical protein NS220_04395 [Microbacterium testaceum]
MRFAKPSSELMPPRMYWRMDWRMARRSLGCQLPEVRAEVAALGGAGRRGRCRRRLGRRRLRWRYAWFTSCRVSELIDEHGASERPL